MNKEIITTKQGICIMNMYLIGSAIILGSGSEAKQDAWIAILLAILITIPTYFVYTRPLVLFSGKNIFDIYEEVLGKFVGKIIILLYSWYAFHLGALVIRNFSEFIQIVSIPETPQPIVMLFIGIICIIAVKAGIEVQGRWTAFFYPLTLIISIILVLLVISKMQICNIKPILYNGLKPVIGSAYAIYSFPFAETVLLTAVFQNKKEKLNVYKVYYISLLLSGIVLLMLTVRNILVLGSNIVGEVFFPSYIVARIINIGGIIDRIEVVISVVFLFAGITKIGMCLYVACIGLSKVLKINSYRSIVVPICFLMIDLACIIYKSTNEMFEWAFKYYNLYTIPFQIIFPIIIFIAAEIKYRTKMLK